MLFKVDNDLLNKLCVINNFILPQNPSAEIVFVGLRGSLPVQPDNNEFGTSQDLRLAEVDYTHPRCTICQWRPRAGQVALFTASTVPHIKYIRSSVARKGEGTNQLMTGFYSDYRKGTHKPGSATGHEAFRETAGHPIRRTADDYDFDNDDRVEFTNPCDNIHAGWCMGINHPDYASAGCQVIVGYPACLQRGSEPAAGPWKAFKENAYSIEQNSFPYVLLNGTEAFAVTQSGTKPCRKLRFGSRGVAVSALQEALKTKQYYEGKIDEDFGERTLRAVLAFQTAAFGQDAGDGIVGSMTASALGLELPVL